MPASFAFVLDEVADGGAVVGVQWHVESVSQGKGEALPFARGCSVYRADPKTGLILSGFDVPEPAPLKPGSAGMGVLKRSIVFFPFKDVMIVFQRTYAYDQPNLGCIYVH